MERNGVPSLCVWVLIILAYCFSTSKAGESDISCLRSIKESLEDPEGVLSSWDFNNNTEGFICFFPGIECWHPDENKVLNIQLPDMGLRGPFPIGIRHCTSITGLDLSNNHLSGPIPSNLTQVIEFITTLKLSNNNFSGPIPPSIVNCTFINVLRLDNNHLTGQIPPQMSELPRLKEFSVANNSLSGPVPLFSNMNYSAYTYANNLGLCGGPLTACKNEDHHDDDDIHFSDYIFFSGFAAGLSLSTFLTVIFVLCWPTLSKRIMRCYHLLVKKIKRRKHHVIPRSPQILFEEEISSMESKVTSTKKFIRRLSLLELLTATNDFESKNVIGYGGMGVMYKAVFPNGLLIAVKRLHRYEH